jgi:hypothetical protein
VCFSVQKRWNLPAAVASRSRGEIRILAENERISEMFGRKVLRLTAVASGLVASAFILGGCATCHSGAKAEKGSQVCSPQARDELYSVKRAPFNGYYHNTPADEGRLWHWGI